MGSINLTFFIQGHNVASSRLRVLQYIPYLKKAEINPKVFEYPKNISGWIKMYTYFRGSDAIFFQRKRPPLNLLILLKLMKKKIIYDFDDAIMFKNSLSENPYSLRRMMSFRRIMRFSDLVIAGNSFLKEEALKFNSNVYVLPTPIDGSRYFQRPHKETGTVNIGWIGDHGSIHYLESYKDVWEEIGKSYKNVILTIICDTSIETEHIKVNPVRWSLETETEELSKIDIGVMPLFDDLWSKGKCGFKIIQYLGMGIPCVCTPVGINKDIVDDGIEGFWARTKEEWIEKLSLLIENPSLRRKMGEMGRKKVTSNFTVEVCAPKLVNYIRSLF
ncbi:MAG: glycosyltransferase family 4 protein [Desulfobacterota bacterium]|nr:glycosyltransferase family 4 protein [Thermodesulfobacteriota bacterium]MDW8002421.1 glycosyltransferase family 4 protein [Deltaproteobacteria bacterium]